MWVYGLIFVFLAFAVFLQGKNRRYATIIILFFSVVYICRAKIGTDYIAYNNYYNMMHSFSDLGTGGFEFGYSFLSLISHILGLPFQCFCMILSTFVIIMLFKTVKKFDLETGLVFFLLLYYFFYPSLEIMRQQAAIVLFFFSLTYLHDMDDEANKRRNVFMYFLLNSTAVLFHRTVLIAFFFYIFMRSKVFKIGITVFFVMFASMQDFILEILQRFPLAYNRYYHYLFGRKYKNFDIDSVSISFKLIEYTILLVVMLYICYKDKWGKHPFRIRVDRLHIDFHHKNKEYNRNDTGISLDNRIAMNVGSLGRIAYNLLLLGILLQIFVAPVLGATYRIVYYCDLGLVLAFTIICQKIKNSGFKLLYLLLIIIYIGIHLVRIFPYDNKLFIYHFLK